MLQRFILLTLQRTLVSGKSACVKGIALTQDCSQNAHGFKVPRLTSLTCSMAASKGCSPDVDTEIASWTLQTSTPAPPAGAMPHQIAFNSRDSHKCTCFILVPGFVQRAVYTQINS